jgi:hypothetical protein
MRVLSSERRWWAALGLVVIGAMLTGASAHLGAVAAAGPGTATTLEQNKRLMLAQRPLVEAATLLRAEVDRGKYTGYAGIVLNGTDSLTLWWKGALPASMATVVAQATRIAPVRIGKALYSRAEIKAAAAQLRAQLRADSQVHTIQYHDDGKGLTLVAHETSAAERSLMSDSDRAQALAAELPKVGVATQVIFRQQLAPISRNDDAAPWKGGAVIVNATIGAGCTSGFGVLAAGNPAILTAGHCATANGQRFQDGSGEFIGNAAQKTNHDQLIIPTSSASNRMYVGNRQSNTTKLVTGWEPCFIGELLCQSGTTTAEAIGSELCGLQVDSFDQDTESLVEAHQINGQQGARPGDSGGPLYSERGADVVAKGTMTRVGGANIGFQDVATANQDFGGIQIPGATGGTNDVELFQHCNFGGWQANFNGSRTVSTAQLQAAGGVNNDASSVRIKAGCAVTLFDGNTQTGGSLRLTATTACFAGALNFNDIVSSLRIECGVGGGDVVFFQHSNFGGIASQGLAPGNYTLAQLQAKGVQNDWVSSARVPAGRTVTVFQHDNFTGTSWTLTSDTPSFSALTPNANDQMSSARIQ